MKEIWKFAITVRPHSGERFAVQPVVAPGLGDVLSAGIDFNDRLVVWCAVEPGAEPVTFWLAVVPTGCPFGMQPEWKFVQTVEEKGLIWHLFARPKL